MTTMRRDPLVDDYLRRLEAAASDLPRERRAELVGEIEEHVEAALAEAGDDETAVRNVLERLGSPEEIAAAARPPEAAPERGWLETAALVVLSVSFLLPVAGYLIGAGLVLASKAWDGREKTLGLLLPPSLVLAGALVVLATFGGGDSVETDGDIITVGPGPVEIAVLAVIVLSGPIAAVYLSSRLRRPTAG
jgi:HAAS domain-containing protein